MRRARRLPTWIAAAAVALACAAPAAFADDFEAELARVDDALRTNPHRVPAAFLDSCLARRNAAARLYASGQLARAERSLAFCKEVLHLSEAAPVVEQPKVPSMEEIQARAGREVEKALALTPDLAHGLAVYRECAACHMPEGWGLGDGSVPQIAGQHRRVVIKQLADIRAGNRDNPLMLPYASVEAIGGTQSVADVAGYIDTLEISVDNDKGPGTDLARGEALYRESCARCHGSAGEGNGEAFVPRLQAQHFRYLARQLERIRDGQRRNANPEMAALIQGYGDAEIAALADYLSRLQPPEDLQAPPDWRNPDFAN